MKILHDVHTHNVLSSCCGDVSASTEAYLKKEAELGNRIFGLSNHIWDERVGGASPWYQDQPIRKAEEAKAALSNAPAGLKTLFGAETEYYHCYDRLGMSVEGARHFDYLLVPHSHQHMRNEVMWDLPEYREMRERIADDIKRSCPYLDPSDVNAMTRAMTEARLKKYVSLTTDIGKFAVDSAVSSFISLMSNPTFKSLTTVLPVSVAHPFHLCGIPDANTHLKMLSDDTLKECFALSRDNGVYIEINLGAVSEYGSSFEENQMLRIFGVARDVGCKFTFGTDSHSV